MRIMIMYDLPMVSYMDLKHYRYFNKFLISEGFIMMQESIYTKLATNKTSADLIIDKVKRNKPPKGLIQVMIVTEKQFAQIEIISGELTSKYINNEERVLRL